MSIQESPFVGECSHHVGHFLAESCSELCLKQAAVAKTSREPFTWRKVEGYNVTRNGWKAFKFFDKVKRTSSNKERQSGRVY